MKARNFEDLLFWGKSKDLAIILYKIFLKNKDFGFKDQILRAGVSVGNNIAEGYERQTNKEFKQFLFIAKGSCGEVRNMLYIGKELGYIDNNDFDKLYNLSLEISKMISGYIKTLDI